MHCFYLFQHFFVSQAFQIQAFLLQIKTKQRRRLEDENSLFLEATL